MENDRFLIYKINYSFTCDLCQTLSGWKFRFNWNAQKQHFRHLSFPRKKHSHLKKKKVCLSIAIQWKLNEADVLLFLSDVQDRWSYVEYNWIIKLISCLAKVTVWCPISFSFLSPKSHFAIPVSAYGGMDECIHSPNNLFQCAGKRSPHFSLMILT